MEGNSLEERLQLHLEALTKSIGPRPSHSPAELQAANYVYQQINQFEKIKSKISSFKSPADIDWILAVLYSCYFLAGIIVFFNSLLSLSLLLIVCFLLYREMSYKPLISRLFKKESRNVLGFLEPNSNIKQEIIVSAHIDSGRVSKGEGSIPPKLERINSTILVIFLVSGPFLLGLIFITEMIGIPLNTNPGFFLIPTLVFISLLALMLFVSRNVRKFGVGANDNGTGTAVLLETANYFSSKNVGSTRIIFLFTGSEESGLRGMLHFLHRCYNKNLPRIYINIDTCGSGTLSMVSKEGWFRLNESDPNLRKIAKKCAEQLKIQIVETPSGGAYLSDLTVVLSRNQRGLTITATEGAGNIPLAHKEDDFLDNISLKSVKNAFSLVTCMMEEIMSIERSKE